MENGTYLAAYWGARAQSVDECAHAVARYLAILAEMDPMFAKWYKKGRARSASAESIVIGPGVLKDLLLAGRNRGDFDGDVIDGLGFAFGAWNKQDVAATSLRVTIGLYAQARGLANSVVLDLPPLAAAPSVYSLERAIALITATAECFDPEWAIWTSDEIRESLSSVPEQQTAGWLTYLASPVSEIGQLPADQVLPLHTGALIVASDDAESVRVETMCNIGNALWAHGLR